MLCSTGTWVHQAHSPDPTNKKNFFPKMFLYLPLEKQFFKRKKIFHTHL